MGEAQRAPYIAACGFPPMLLVWNTMPLEMLLPIRLYCLSIYYLFLLPLQLLLWPGVVPQPTSFIFATIRLADA